MASTIIGHKTAKVFERYNIVSPTELKAAAAMLADSPISTGTTNGTTADLSLTGRA